MKNYTTRFLKAVALAYMGFPIVYIVGTAILFDIPGNRIGRILLSPWYYLVSLVAVAAGYGLWEMKRWAWYLFVGANIMIAYQNAIFLNDYSESHHKGVAFAFSILMLAGLIYRLAREVRVPYFFPKIRWWESDPRYKLSVPAIFSRTGSTPIEGQILDLSMGGCFIKLRTDIKEHEDIELQFTVFGEKVHCSGTVVWRTQSTVTHPRGAGVKFHSLTRHERRTLKQIYRRLRKISAFYRRSRYLLNQDEFMKQLEKIETSVIHPATSAAKKKKAL